jgi:nicotinate-nucleotide adenylyltransferase
MELAPAMERATMCRIATAGDPLFEVSDIELKRSGPSFTIDTVRTLKAMGHRDVAWLIGADMLQILPKWHLARELIHEARILVMNRPGFAIDWSELPQEFRTLKANVVDAPLIEVSATEIRRRIRAGDSVAGLVPDAVLAYIREKGLYGARAGGG